jgi:hypothetical protein
MEVGFGTEAKGLTCAATRKSVFGNTNRPFAALHKFVSFQRRVDLTGRRLLRTGAAAG